MTTAITGAAPTTEALLEERGGTHGSFDSNAHVSQEMKALYRRQPAWAELGERQREALDMIAAKVSRILSSPDPAHVHDDNWADIIGYSQLAR